MSRLPAPDTAQREILGLLARLRGQAGGESTEAFKLWLRTFRSVYGECFFSPGPKAETALRKLYHPPESSSYHEILFSVHTHFALVVRATARRRGILLHDRDGLFEYSWDGRKHARAGVAENAGLPPQVLFELPGTRRRIRARIFRPSCGYPSMPTAGNSPEGRRRPSR